ncbi:MAG: hypothetical protein ACE5HE_12765, partial [Phycisphaerae bacterium]
RRVGHVAKAAKWMRRHKALTAAVTACVVAVAAGSGWAYTSALARQTEAGRLLQRGYDRLMYQAYQRPDRADDDVAAAERLGAQGPKLVLTKALLELGAGDPASALTLLEPLLQADPTDVEALYMASWAYAWSNDKRSSHAAFTAAEDLGGAQTAAAFFLRGLAIHFEDPALAIESYRQANALRVAEGEFFPQAQLHLARAHNQRLYATRSIESFNEALKSLHELIENGHYGALPHYLLSIAYRLAGEIYDGSAGVPQEQAREYFEMALYWAREGQKVNPASDRPVTAEAECLEQIGQFHEAIAARSRAMELAISTPRRCESLHYRWRLHYWVGNLDEALSDIVAHAECMPDSPFYAHVYPALVYAEQGRLAEAENEARALAGASSGDAKGTILAASCMRLVGLNAEADQLLNERLDSVDYGLNLEPPQTEEWVQALYGFCAGLEQFETLEQLARDADAPRKLRGEANFHAGVKALAQGMREQAINHFFNAYRSFDGATNYTFHGKILQQKLASDQHWPEWMGTDN